MKAASPSRRRVLVATGDEDRRAFTHMDLRMLVYLDGRERTLEEFTAITGAAGLAITAVIPAEQGNSIIVRAASGGTLCSLTTRRWPLIESERGNGTLPFAAQYDAE